MGRGWKILIGVAIAIAALLALNAIVTEGETKSALVDEPGGRILHLRGGDIQVVEHGPRTARRSVTRSAVPSSPRWRNASPASSNGW